MSRILLLVTLMLAALAVAPGVASADLINGPRFGEIVGSPELEEYDDEFIALNANNQPQQNGVKVAFFVAYRCTAGETAGFFAHADSVDAPAEGGGGAQATCNGEVQYALAIAQRSQSPVFLGNNSLAVNGIGFTADANGDVTDLEFQSETLNPYNPNNDPES